MEKKAARILVTSCKGGVGKSTVCANLALALSMRGRKTLAVDMDIGNRALDLILGCEDAAFFSIEDVCAGNIGIDRAVRSAGRENLFFIPAPRRYRGGITKEKLRVAIDGAEELFAPDFILFDTSGGVGASAELSAFAADRALIITTQSPASVRAAEKTGEILDEYGIKEQALIINCFNAAGDRAGVLEIIDLAKTKIAGIIPYDEKMAAASEKGLLAAEIKRSPGSDALRNIAARLCGENVPLLSGVRGVRHRHKVLIKR